MNPIAFTCSFCSRPVAAPATLAGRMDTCPHCQSPVLVPVRTSALSATPSNAKAIPALPDFGSSLRLARDATDSIFHDPAEDGDSLFGPADTSRKPVMPAAAPTATAKSTARIPGLSNAPRQRAMVTPIAIPAPFVPAVAIAVNPFESLADEEEIEDSARMNPPDDASEEVDSVAARPIPWKNLLIGALALYSVSITVIAAWGWLRTAPAAHTAKR